MSKRFHGRLKQLWSPWRAACTLRFKMQLSSSPHPRPLIKRLELSRGPRDPEKQKIPLNPAHTVSNDDLKKKRSLLCCSLTFALWDPSTLPASHDGHFIFKSTDTVASNHLMRTRNSACYSQSRSKLRLRVTKNTEINDGVFFS